MNNKGNKLILAILLFLTVVLPVSVTANELQVKNEVSNELSKYESEAKNISPRLSNDSTSQTYSGGWDVLYSTVEQGGYIGTHQDSYYKDEIDYYYLDLVEQPNQTLTLSVELSGYYSRIYDNYIFFDFFKEGGSGLDYIGTSEFILDYPYTLTGTLTLNTVHLDRMTDQEYLYVQVGSAGTLSDLGGTNYDWRYEAFNLVKSNRCGLVC